MAFGEDPAATNALFLGIHGVAQLPVEKEYIVGALNGHNSLFSLLFEVRVSRPIFDSANSGHYVCRLSRLEQMGQQSERGSYS